MNLSLAFALMLAASPVMAQETCIACSSTSLVGQTCPLAVYEGSAATTNDAIDAYRRAAEYADYLKQEGNYARKHLLALYACEATKSREDCP